MISFEFLQDEKKNFTPSAKIFEYAKRQKLNCYRTQFGTQVLEYNSNNYTYDHFTIWTHPDGTETVEIFLKLI